MNIAFLRKYTLKPQLVLFVFLILSSLNAQAQVLRKRTTMLMGSKFDITVVANDSAEAVQSIDLVVAEISRIENLISEWIPGTQVSEINRNAGIQPVKVNKEVFELTQRAIKLSEMTGGAFDISFAAMDKIWKFDGSMTEMPTPEAVKKSVEKVGYQNIVLDSTNSTVFLRLEGMKIGFGSIGKGYAADKGRSLMLERGIKAGIVNASGDMTTWGTQPDGSDWNIGITNPGKPNQLLGTIQLQHGALTTSGSYENYVTFNGKRYSHIINPATGYPATGLSSVTVFGPSAEMANGFSTSLMVLGKEAGLELIRKHPDYNCILVTDKGKVFYSDKRKLDLR
ncbi:FAD:protein FMN transferase [Dyadobacter sp. CY312]|uniref:FAD:protein FMN transferase n=1 Tax=Dyadobacter sp. CY312 TaxID=2907303 RepID=UPI001F367AD7|nr:FAD:protein FMN transferase [Dyadobacter sp. CY312]MCE7042478.1 FAD:protein FMN transferase [Dyadobacter sp. CY312]